MSAVDDILNDLDYVPGYPPETIRGVPLSDGQYDDYVRISGRLWRTQLANAAKNDSFGSLSPETRLAIINEAMAKARDNAATQIMMKSLGTDNDIVRQATAAKYASLQAKRGLGQARGARYDSGSAAEQGAQQ